MSSLTDLRHLLTTTEQMVNVAGKRVCYRTLYFTSERAARDYTPPGAWRRAQVAHVSVTTPHDKRRHAAWALTVYKESR